MLLYVKYIGYMLITSLLENVDIKVNADDTFMG